MKSNLDIMKELAKIAPHLLQPQTAHAPKREHFREDRICSSKNYELSRKIHASYLKREHEKNKQEVLRITQTTKIRTRYFIRVFGKEMEVSEERALILEQDMTVIRR